MLTKIVIDGVATFRSPTTLETDKRVNLLYGLNGSGKSTIARLLRKPKDPSFQKCSVIGAQGKKVLVFNEDFVRENFYESPTIKGIFSLSKKNKEAEEKIAAARAECGRLAAAVTTESDSRERSLKSLDAEASKIVDVVFEIKRKYSGGDRLLEFCLTGLMGSREKLFEHLRRLEKPDVKPGFSVTNLQDEVRLLGKAGETSPEAMLPMFKIEAGAIESDSLFQKAIVGAQNSSLGELIEKLQNADWVRSGLTYADLDSEKPSDCPFCQKPTIDVHFAQEIRAYFDKSYDDQIQLLAQHKSSYEELASRLPSLAALQASRFYDKQIDSKYAAVEALLGENKLLIESKLKNPSSQITLKSTEAAEKDLADALRRVNEEVTDYNNKIANRDAALEDVKQRFWILMRWEYDEAVQSHRKNQIDRQSTAHNSAAEIAKLEKLIAEQNAIISSAQKDTVNVDAAIARINAELVDLGVLDFRITKHSHHMYQLERPSGGLSTFDSLSEGEKMIIALLYFCELCDGNEAENEISSERIIVVDDPISSMSHIYIFNVGRLLRTRFIDSTQFSQVFIFTHSLYFFYELADMNHKRRAETQSLFRVVKNPSGSSLVQMKYEDIQNDYQAYWQIINDHNQSPALIANCMRNVVEYFFGFVEKKSYANVFQKPELSKIRFQAFNRYMNRESHSFGQNVFDLKEFNYQDFRDGLKEVFETCGYGEHYRQMTRIQ